MAAKSLPWRTPEGQQIGLAAAVPRQVSTDLLDALAPSGREGRARPSGVLKSSMFAALWGVGRVTPWFFPGYPHGSLETVAPGHRVELELSQTDAPYLRPNATASTLTLSEPRLTLSRTAGLGVDSQQR